VRALEKLRFRLNSGGKAYGAAVSYQSSKIFNVMYKQELL
jgi:hypothetical protein